MPKHKVSKPIDVRDDVWAVSQANIQLGEFDKAIFEVFKYIESVIQERIGSTAIGSSLIDEAFDARKIDIPGNAMDARSLKQIFKGSIGYYRGDRAHGKTSLPIRTAKKCGRVLNLASALMDLLDADRNIIPTILSDETTPSSTTLICQNLTDTTVCTINGTAAAVIGRSAGSITLDIESLPPTTHHLQLIDGEREGPLYDLFVAPAASPIPGGNNWYRVKAADLPVYTDEKMTQVLPTKAVLLECDESGHRSLRCFPTQKSYSIGDYVTWEWDFGRSIDSQGWVKLPSGQVESAWLGSAPFAGQIRGKTGSPSAVELRLSIGESLQLRPGSTAELGVLAIMSDGIVRWRERLPHSAYKVSSSNEACSIVDKSGVLHAKAFGQTHLTISYRGKHAHAEVYVASTPEGSTYTLSGGYPLIPGVARTAEGIVFTDRTSSLRRLDSGLHTSEIARIKLPDLSPHGLDSLCADEKGNIYVRTPSHHGGFVRFNAPDYTRLTEVELPDGHVAMGLIGLDRGALITDTAGVVWILDEKSSSARPYVQCPTPQAGGFTLTHGTVDKKNVYVLNNVGQMYVIDRITKKITVRTVNKRGGNFSAILATSNGILVTDFHEGRLLKLNDDDTTTELAMGLGTPTGIIEDSDESVLISDFSGGRIVRVYLS